MKSYQGPVFLLTASILLMSIKPVSQASAGQHDQPRPNFLMRGPGGEFVSDSVKRLGINILIIDKISLKEASPVNDHSVPVSKEKLLDALIVFLHDNNAMLVKSGVICQIVPLSRKLGTRWEAIARLEDIPIIQRTSRPLAFSAPRVSSPYVSMAFDGLFLPEFCEQVAKDLNLNPIVIAPAVKGSATLITSMIRTEMLLPILTTVLENNDAVLVEFMGEYQIVPKSKELPKEWKVLTDLPQSVPSIKQ
jgi:hypothetical protein